MDIKVISEKADRQGLVINWMKKQSQKDSWINDLGYMNRP